MSSANAKQLAANGLFAATIRQAMNEKGLTARQVNLAMNRRRHDPAIYLYLNGKMVPKREYILAGFAKALDIPVERLKSAAKQSAPITRRPVKQEQVESKWVFQPAITVKVTPLQESIAMRMATIRERLADLDMERESLWNEYKNLVTMMQSK